MRVKPSQLLALLVTIAVFCLFSDLSFASSPRSDWQECKSDHFIIYYHPSIPSKYIREFTRRCERYYFLIAERLGFRRFDFWSWEKRAKVFIYASREEYIRKSALPARSLASVQVKKKKISTFYCDRELMDNILAHEIAHLVLRELIGLDTEVPLWFEEGVAAVNEHAAQTKYLFEREYLAQLCAQVREENNFSEAVQKVYGLKDIQVFQQQFLAYLNSQNPS